MKQFQITRRTFLISSIAASAQFKAFAQQHRNKPRVGCQTNGWVVKGGTFDGLIDVLHSAKEIGYEGFECNVRFVNSEFRNATEARKKIQATGMEFIGVHMSLNMGAKPDFPATARGAAQLGARNVMTSAAGLSPDGKFTPEALHAKVAQIEAMAKICHDNGIRFAYHNHTAEFANGNAEIQALAENTTPELVHFLMDAGHGYQGGGDPAKFMLQHSERIVGCHLKTFRNKTQQVPLGQGDFDFKALAAIVKKTHWAGWLMDEEGGGTRIGNTAAVASDRQYIRNIFGV